MLHIFHVLANTNVSEVGLAILGQWHLLGGFWKVKGTAVCRYRYPQNLICFVSSHVNTLPGLPSQVNDHGDVKCAGMFTMQYCLGCSLDQKPALQATEDHTEITHTNRVPQQRIICETGLQGSWKVKRFSATSNQTNLRPSQDLSPTFTTRPGQQGLTSGCCLWLGDGLFWVGLC